jgi:hypothetical protein
MEVTAVQVQREPLDRLLAAHGGSIYLRHRKPPSRSKPIYVWTLSGPRAVNLMMTLEPLMSPVRQAQIRAALDEWRTRPGTGARNRVKTHCPKGHPYDEENTLIVMSRGKHPSRQCRACHREWFAARKNA